MVVPTVGKSDSLSVEKLVAKSVVRTECTMVDCWVELLVGMTASMKVVRTVSPKVDNLDWTKADLLVATKAVWTGTMMADLLVCLSLRDQSARKGEVRCMCSN